jgi:hypothetical protein
MSKKTASALAGLIVGALSIAMVAVTFHVGTLKAAPARPSKRAPAPIVREVTRTITIHKKDRGADQSAPVVTIVQVTTTGSSDEPGHHDDEKEGEHKDEGHEGEHHEDEEHKGEEHKDEEHKDEHHEDDHHDEPPGGIATRVMG